jgi:hypothetical protein
MIYSSTCLQVCRRAVPKHVLCLSSSAIGNWYVRTLLAGCLVLSLTVSGCKRTHDDKISPADKLAAHPNDPTKPSDVPGVPDAKFDSPEAIEAAVMACVEAVKASPKEPRYEFELGRVLLLGGMMDEAREHLEAAAQQGHGAAYFYLGGMELDAAKGFFQQAAAAKFKPADTVIADLKSIDAFRQPRSNWRQRLAVVVGGLAAISVVIFLLIRWRRPTTQPLPPESGPLPNV